MSDKVNDHIMLTINESKNEKKKLNNRHKHTK